MNSLFKNLLAISILVLVLSDVKIAHPAAIQLKINTISATESPWHKAMLKFSEIVKSKSKGGIEVLVYADGQLGDI